MSKRDPAIPEGERIWLAAIGKHPGWNDHLDDIGLDMDRLVAVKRQIYVDGIGGVIGAGTWEAMDDAARDEGFSHSFLWRQPDGLVVGRMWSSSDGKGRRKFPMIVCALCRSLPLSSVGGAVLNRLRRLEAQCKEAETAAEVISAVDAMQTELRELASHTPPVTADPFAGEPAAAVLADAPEMGPEGVGLRRVLYQMEREMAAFLRPEGATRSRSRTLEIRAQHMRVPAVFETEEECWSAWARLLLGRVDQLAPLLLISKDGRPWLDIIVGDPNAAILACLQGSTEAFPLTTDIPFTIDEQNEQAARELIDRARKHEVVETDPGYLDVSSERLAPFMRPARRPSAGTEKNTRQLVWVSAAAVAALIVIAVLAYMFFGGGHGGGGQTDSGATGAETSRAPPPAEPPAPAITTNAPPASSAGIPAKTGASNDQMDRFRRWCRVADMWYLPFVDSLDTEAASSDPYLASVLLGRLREADGVELNPLRVAPGRYSSIKALAAHPPDEMGEPGHKQEIDDALRLIDGVRGAIAEDAWPARRALVGALARFPQAPDMLTSIRDALDGEAGAPAAGAVAQLARVHEPVERLAGAVRSIDESADRLRAADGAGEQADLLVSISPGGKPGGTGDAYAAGWLDRTAAKADEIAALGEQLADAAERDLPRVDRDLLVRAMALHTGDAPEQRLHAWLSALEDKSLYLLDPSTDPRRALSSGSDVKQAETRLAAMEAEKPDDRLEALLDRGARWQQDKADLDALTWNEANRETITENSRRLAADRDEILGGLDSIERERRYEAESYLEQLRAAQHVSTTGSGAIDTVWLAARDGLIGRYETDHDLVGLTRKIDALRSALASVESAMPPVRPGPLGAAGDRLRELLDARREAMLGEAAARYDQPGVLAKLRGEYESWASGVLDAVESARRLIDACDAWTLPGDPLDGSTHAGGLENWGGSWLGERIGLGEIDPRLGVLAESGASRETLIGRIRDGATPPAVAFAAWITLPGADPAWPADADELAIDADAVDRLRRASAGLDQPRRDQVLGVIERQAAARWSRVAKDADGWGGVKPLVPIARQLGLTGEQVGPSMAYDLLVASLMGRVERDEPLDAGTILSGIDALPAADLGAGARRWLGTLRGVLTEEQPEVDYRTIGPGRVGWSVERYESGRQLKYILPREGADEISLSFTLVDAPGTGPVYLCNTEAPASLLLEYALNGPFADAVESALDPDWAPLEDPRRGPHVWTWRRQRGGGRGIGLSRSWTTPAQGYDFYPPVLTDRISRPGMNSPLQRISPQAAGLIAASVGCRLPRAGEWLAAYDATDRPEPGGAWNLRDQTFRVQRDHMATLAAARWPDDGVFAPAGSAFETGATAAYHDWSDGVLWFDPVASDAGHPFHHLIGNVAEYVLLVNAPGTWFTDQPSDGGGDGGVVGIAAIKKPVGVGVIGGSALSPPGLPVARAAGLDGVISVSGFSDVGFRLAFSPGGEAPLAVRIGQVLGSAPFLR